MRIPGQRVKRQRLVRTDKYVVAVDVEMVIPVDDPSEPCYEAETVELVVARGHSALPQGLLMQFSATGASVSTLNVTGEQHDRRTRQAQTMEQLDH